MRTPPDEHSSVVLHYAVAAARNINLHMTAPRVIVDMSTVPVGAADKFSGAITV
jgi:UDPglucose 6-dehydrogenase